MNLERKGNMHEMSLEMKVDKDKSNTLSLNRSMGIKC